MFMIKIYSSYYFIIFIPIAQLVTSLHECLNISFINVVHWRIGVCIVALWAHRPVEEEEKEGDYYSCCVLREVQIY